MEIRYAQSDDVSLAYAVEGEEGLPLIFIPGIVSNLAMDPSIPSLARFNERISRFCRFVRWDRRGTASDNPVSVRGLAYITAGHVAHHIGLLKERYL